MDNTNFNFKVDLTTEESQMLEKAVEILGLSIEEIAKQGLMHEARSILQDKMLAENASINSTLLD